jgi:hypothetical protein
LFYLEEGGFLESNSCQSDVQSVKELYFLESYSEVSQLLLMKCLTREWQEVDGEGHRDHNGEDYSKLELDCERVVLQGYWHDTQGLNLRPTGAKNS